MRCFMLLARAIPQTMGAPNLELDTHLCASPTAVMECTTYGRTSLYGFDLEKGGMVVLWGINPTTSAFAILWPQVLTGHRKLLPI